MGNETKPRLAISVFVDALGADILEEHLDFLPQLSRSRVRSIFGYSSACVPAILSGSLPRDNGHWSSFYYSNVPSALRHLRPLRFIPKFVRERGRIRGKISQLVAKAYGYRGYFQLYNIPFEELHRIDYAEKNDIYELGGMNEGQSIFDWLYGRGQKYWVGDWRKNEDEYFADFEAALNRGEEMSFAFLYTAKCDGLLHAHGTQAAEIDDYLNALSKRLSRIVELAEERYEVAWIVMSDHGMRDVRAAVDMMSVMDGIGLDYGEDYLAVFDSTMARFWWLKDSARGRVMAAFPGGENADGRWLSQDEFHDFGIDVPDRRFGEDIYLLKPGLLLCPSHMGRTMLAGMHGYDPADSASDASLLRSESSPVVEATRITDFFGQMQELARWAQP